MTEIEDGEQWEHFARDFLRQLGYSIESGPGRGADGGRDLLASENLTGILGNYPFRWVVSCKHFAQSGSSVGVDDEQNIVERVTGAGCDGFLGFYSTVPSSALNSRLSELRDNRQLKDFRIFDRKLIENYLVRVGYSEVMLRYLPESYKRLRPLHALGGTYEPLTCDYCGTDILMMYGQNQPLAVVGLVSRVEHDESGHEYRFVSHIYSACKGECDRTLASRLGGNLGTSWVDVRDLTVPIELLDWIFSLMNRMHSSDNRLQFSPTAFDFLKHVIRAVGQKALRETTEEEKQRFDTGRLLEGY